MNNKQHSGPLNISGEAGWGWTELRHQAARDACPELPCPKSLCKGGDPPPAHPDLSDPGKTLLPHSLPFEQPFRGDAPKPRGAGAHTGTPAKPKVPPGPAQRPGSSPPAEVIAPTGWSGYVPRAGRWLWGDAASPWSSSVQAGYHPQNPVLDQDPLPSSQLQSHHPTCPFVPPESHQCLARLEKSCQPFGAHPTVGAAPQQRGTQHHPSLDKALLIPQHRPGSIASAPAWRNPRRGGVKAGCRQCRRGAVTRSSVPRSPTRGPATPGSCGTRGVPKAKGPGQTQASPGLPCSRCQGQQGVGGPWSEMSQ